jgi:hypothetical protein
MYLRRGSQEYNGMMGNTGYNHTLHYYPNNNPSSSPNGSYRDYYYPDTAYHYGAADQDSDYYSTKPTIVNRSSGA